MYEKKELYIIHALCLYHTMHTLVNTAHARNVCIILILFLENYQKIIFK